MDGHLKVLLLQIREEQHVIEEERESFVKYAGLHHAQLDAHNVFENPEFGPEILEGYDALFVGGASTASVLHPEIYTFVPSCIELLKHCADIGFPTFASCFGFQLGVLALGGQIVRDEKAEELGSLPMTLLPAAADDKLFHDTPDGFLAVTVHQESALNLPEGCELLVKTDKCCHAFKVHDKPFWAFQFHPEVDKAILVQRLGVYKDKYTGGEEAYQAHVKTFKEVPHSTALVRKFVERVLLD